MEFIWMDRLVSHAICCVYLIIDILPAGQSVGIRIRFCEPHLFILPQFLTMPWQFQTPLFGCDGRLGGEPCHSHARQQGTSRVVL
jgi:hypothetical protein